MTKNFVAYRLLIDVIDYSSMLLIIHWCYWLLIDYLLITHLLLIDFSTFRSFIMLHNFYSLLRISLIFLYYNYLSSHKSSSWIVIVKNLFFIRKYYSSMTNRDSSTDYLSITHWLFIDVIDFIEIYLVDSRWFYSLSSLHLSISHRSTQLAVCEALVGQLLTVCQLTELSVSCPLMRVSLKRASR